jgi:hypothetical protein
MSMDTPPTRSGLAWIADATERGCPDYTLQPQTERALRDVLTATRREAGPDAVRDVARRLAARAERGRPPSATQARAIAREEVRDRGVELTMASPLARSSGAPDC